MPTKILAPHRYRRIRHTATRRGKVDINVEASAPVSVYVVKAEDLPTYRKDYTFKYRDIRDLSEKLDLPFSPGETWYLVIRNKSDEPAAVHYEVFY